MEINPFSKDKCKICVPAAPGVSGWPESAGADGRTE
jgi:hypothetical protein